jgi:hypothetical protein
MICHPSTPPPARACDAALWTALSRFPEVIRVCDGQGSTPRRNPVTIAIEEGVRAADLSRLSGCLTRVV